MKEHPRCSNCPDEATCPHGKQLCDHEACSLHPRENRWIENVIEAIHRNDEKEFDYDDND
jgi:hypothetical protein